MQITTYDDGVKEEDIKRLIIFSNSVEIRTKDGKKYYFKLVKAFSDR